MKALEFHRNIPRYAAARVAATFRSERAASIAPLKLSNNDPPKQLGHSWVQVLPRLSGICGSDLATMTGKSARYFEPLVSFPFIPGHEIVGDLSSGTRIVVEPILGCVSRNILPPCSACTQGHLGNCQYTNYGDLQPGIQTGSCHDTGGGWAVALNAHTSQLHSLDEDLSDEAAVMIEPAACAIHATLLAKIADGSTVTVLGSGTLGLLTIAAIRAFTNPRVLVVSARYPTQRRLASELGADLIVEPDAIQRAIRRVTSSRAISKAKPDGSVDRLTGGSDIVIDCVGSSSSLTDSLTLVRPRGRVVLVGMPASVTLELTPLWHREVELVGAYTYGTETLSDGSSIRTFDLAKRLVKSADLGRLVSATYPLDRYKEALEHAAEAGRRGAIKVAFDLREEKERERLLEANQ